MTTDDEDPRQYLVVINHEEQYSIWLAERPLPRGWNAVARRGTKAECLKHIEQIWQDMRPLSLRRQLAALDD